MQVLMLYCGDSPHPSHQGFANAIGADWYGLDESSISKIEGSIPAEISNGVLVDDYDIYIAEGTRSLYGGLAGQLFNDSPLIYLAGDQSLYELQHRNDPNQSVVNRLIGKYGMSTLQRAFNRYIDGTIANSRFTAGFTSDLLDTPIRVAEPFIQPKLYERLGEVDPPLNENVAVTVGSYAWYKGQDLLPDVWSRVREHHPDAELYLVGSGYPEHLGNTPGITVCGYVDDLLDIISNASLYVHPARAESFGVSVVEALYARLPAVVTATTGSKSAVQNVDEEMIVNTSSRAIADGIIDYFDKPVEARRQRSQAARKQGATFDSESKKATFRKEFEALLDELAVTSST